MDTNNWRPSQGGEPSTDAGDRNISQLSPGFRQSVSKRIFERLVTKFPPTGQEELHKLNQIAIKFEGRMYTSATSQSDYLNNINRKLNVLANSTKNTTANSVQSNSAGNGNKRADPGSFGMQPQVPNQGQSFSTPLSANQSEARQQLVSQNIQKNIPPAGLSSALLPSSGLTQTPIRSYVGQHMQNMSGTPQNSLGNSMGQGLPSNVFANSQRQMQGRQQVVAQQQQQSQNSQQDMYHQQLEQPILKPNFQQGNIPQLVQSQPQLQQGLLQRTQLHSSQQPVMQTSTDMQAYVVLSTLSSLQQNEQSVIQQSTPSMPQQHPHSVIMQKQQPQTSQQPLLSSQPAHMQQLGVQQQSNSLRDMHHRIQASGQVSGTMFLSQNVMDQRKQLYQSQSALPETPSTSLDSTAPNGHATADDWKEEVYQKITVMKEMYLPDLFELYQKIAKLQPHDALPPQPKSEQLDKLKIFKATVMQLISFLQISKHSISADLRDKLVSIEKQVVYFVNKNRSNTSRKPVSSQQQGQLHPPHMHSMQQSQSQSTQVQSHETQMNPLLQSMDLKGSVATRQQKITKSMPQNSMSHLSGALTAQQNMMCSSQPSSNMDFGQPPVSAPQQENMNAFSSQSGVDVQQTPISAPHQMSLLHQDVNGLKMRQEVGIKSGVVQQHISAGQRAYPHRQGKSRTHIPKSSTTEILQAASSQNSQHSCPIVDQLNLLTHPKAGTPLQTGCSPGTPLKASCSPGTPLQSSCSPFVIPSPSTPMAPSPMPGDMEKPFSLSNAENIKHQQATRVGAQVHSLAIGSPGISASPFLADSAPDDVQVNALSTISEKSSVTEQPMERLIRVVKSMSPNTLSAAVSDIGSAVSMTDRIAASAPDNGCRGAVGEDLVAMTRCHLQGRSVLSHDGTNGTSKRRRGTSTSTAPLNVVSSAGSMNNSFKQLNGSDISELESTATSRIKRPRVEANQALFEEIREIKGWFIDTVVDISDEGFGHSVAAAEGVEGTIINCSFDAVSLSPNLKSQYALSPIQPLRLLVPPDYPNCPPILLDKFPVEVSKDYEGLSAQAKSRFSRSLRNISHPMSVGDIARTWDACARAVISEHAQQSGGGSFSSQYGTWEDCLSAA